MHWKTADDEIARLLARRLEASGQPPETRVTVAELHRVLLPYHECREALGFATKAEYDVALLRFLKQGQYVRIDETGLAEAVEEELSSPEPGLAFLKHFAAAQLEVRSPAVDGAAGEGSEGAPAAMREEAAREEATREEATREEATREEADRWLEELEPEAGPFPRAAGAAADPPPAPSAESAAGPPPVNGREALETACRSCVRPLPGRAELRFCPHCGADQRLRRCGRCGEDLELEWSYCPRCGGAAKG